MWTPLLDMHEPAHNRIWEGVANWAFWRSSLWEIKTYINTADHTLMAWSEDENSSCNSATTLLPPKNKKVSYITFLIGSYFRVCLYFRENNVDSDSNYQSRIKAGESSSHTRSHSAIHLPKAFASLQPLHTSPMWILVSQHLAELAGLIFFWGGVLSLF